MSASLARYLKDFSAPPPSVTPDPFEFSGAQAPQFDFEPEPAVDVEALRSEAREEGRAEAVAELTAQHQHALAALAAAHEEAQANLAQTLQRQLAETFAQSVAAAAEEIRQTLADQVLDALKPVLDQRMAERAVDSLSTTLRSTFEPDGGIELVVRGPAALADMLLERLGGDGYALKHVEGPGPDLSVEYDETVLKTRLAAWRDSVEELMT